MAKQTQLRRGTSAEQAAFAGAIGEVSINTTDSRIAVHNGSKLGGFPAIHENGDKGLDLTLTGNANLTAKNITLKDSTLDSSLSISSSGIRMRDGSIDRLVIDDSAFYIKDNSNVDIQNDRTFYNNAGGYVLSLDNKILYHNSTTIVDWSVQGLYSADSLVSMSWNERQCYNNAEVITLDWNNNTLWRNNGGAQQIAFNWSGCQTYDQAGIQSINWNNRQLTKSDGSTVVLNWESQIAEILEIRKGGDVAIDVFNFQLSSSEPNITLDWDARKLYSLSTVQSLDWLYGITYKADGTTITSNWQNQTLNNGSAITLDWNNKILSGTWNANNLNLTNYILSNGGFFNSIEAAYLASYGDGGDSVFDMLARELRYNGDTVLNWNNRVLSGTWNVENAIVQDIKTPLINKVNSDPSINVDSNLLYDNNSFATSIDYGNRLLLDDSSNTMLSWNFNNRTLSGNWTSEKLTANTGIFNNKVGVGVTDPLTLLHVKGTSSILTAAFTNSNNYGVYFGSETSETFGTVQAAQLGVGNNVNLALQRYGGKVSISHITPNYQLDVLGTGAFQSILITGFSLAPATSTSLGIKGQIATSGAFLFVATGTNQWGRVALSNW